MQTVKPKNAPDDFQCAPSVHPIYPQDDLGQLIAKSTLDYQMIADEAVNACEKVLSHWLPGGRQEGMEYVALNPTRADRNRGSFKVNTLTGKSADFATEKRGGDLISLVAYLDDLNQAEAAGRLTNFLGIECQRSVPGVPCVPVIGKSLLEGLCTQNMGANTKCSVSVPRVPVDKWRAVVPIPADAPKPLQYHPKLGEPAAVWCYRDVAGNAVCFIYRFNKINGGKEFRPLIWSESTESGKCQWRWSGLTGPRPLYKLNLLAQHSHSTVIICEGEKAADAAGVLFPLPAFVTTTALNGCKSMSKTDWSTLAGRNVWLWPDNDQAGKDGMAEAAKLIRKVGPRSLGELRLGWFGRLPDGTERNLPEKWDAADALSEGYTAEDMAGFCADPANVVSTQRAPGSCRLKMDGECEELEADKYGHHSVGEIQKTGESPYSLIEWREGFRNGVHFIGTNREGEVLPPRWICSPLHVTAVTRSTSQEGWGRLLEWNDRDSFHHVWAMPIALTIGDGVEFCKELADRGLEIEPGAKSREHLIRYVTSARPEESARCTGRTGWHDGLFVLPHKTVGQASERVIFQSAAGAGSAFRERGTLPDWRDAVSALCRGNSRLLFVVSAAFASVLLELVGVENGGFHLMGESSEGKSSALYAAASVFGGHDYKRQWNATVNGVEAIAAAHSGALLILDELAQCDPKAAGEAAYLLANGSGKQRATRSGGARNRSHWRVLFLSSGEIDLAQHMREGGKKVRAGQEVRLLAVPSNPGAGHGIYEVLHGFEGGAALSRAITERTRELHGTAGIGFIEAVASNLENIPDIVNALCKDFLGEHLPKEATGQAYRAAERFALCAVAGEMATRFGITGWEEREATQGVVECFRAWMDHRGGAGNQEAAAILSQIRAFFETHGEARFVSLENADSHPIIRERAGFRRSNHSGGWDFYVLPETFKAELCAGFSHQAVVKLLTKCEILKPDSAGRSSRSLTLPGMGKARAYVIDGEKLWADS